MNISICIENLGKYNEGELVFEWIQLPSTEDKLNELLKRIGINKYYEEWFIADYEAPFTIDEYESIFELNNMAEELVNIDEEVLCGIIDSGYTLKEAIEIINNGNYYYIEAINDTELAENYINEVYGDVSQLDNDTLSRYFDYESFGRDLSFDFMQTDNGYINIG